MDWWISFISWGHPLIKVNHKGVSPQRRSSFSAVFLTAIMSSISNFGLVDLIYFRGGHLINVNNKVVSPKMSLVKLPNFITSGLSYDSHWGIVEFIYFMGGGPPDKREP